mmetsp:Transcript_18325/g.70789  ORF Transcript_18325/g.70789 Transcript_18325/m.70789 type:complete len:365 (+) Transcript_18325:2-1096(+)
MTPVTNEHRESEEESEEETDSYEALVGVDSIQRENEKSLKGEKRERTLRHAKATSPTVFRATYRRPGAVRTAKPMQIALGGDLAEVISAAEEFLAMNFPNELQFQRRDADWRKQPPTDQQLFFARRLRQFPSTKGEISTSSRIRQLRKLTSTRVREVAAFMQGSSGAAEFSDDPELAALLEEEQLLVEAQPKVEDPATKARQIVAGRAHQWFEAYKAKRPLRFILALSFKEYTALEVTQNMLGLWDVWKIVDSDRKLQKATKKAEQELFEKRSQATSDSDGEPLDMKSLEGAILLAEFLILQSAPKSQLKFLQNPRKAKWKLEPATDRQKQFLVSLGYEGDDIHHLSKGQISRLISRYKAQKAY